MNTQLVSINKIKPNPNNPRVIKDYRFDKLVKSIQDFPEMLKLRPIVVDNDMMVLGGNMRLKACEKAGHKKVYIIKAEDFTDEQKKEFIIKDNLGYGEWNWEVLNDEWDKDLLDDWGLESEFEVEEDNFSIDVRPKKLLDRFIIPPFSVLDTKLGHWQQRKNWWLALGIKSEVGRKEGLTYGKTAQPPRYYELKNEMRAKGMPTDTESVFKEAERRGMKLLGGENGSTSIFDPVLCELAYQWFNVQDGKILDPFAGGSVRGIVASKLGFEYYGNDLSKEQIEANKQNWLEINSEEDEKDVEFVDIKISSKMARTLFVKCEPGYIKSRCKGACCQSSVDPSGTKITIHPSEVKMIEGLGAKVENGLLKSVNKKCPFKTSDSLCGLHNTGKKPFGCIASPFTLNNNDTLIIRNRYKMLTCFKDKGDTPAYKNFKASLDLIFGIEESNRIVKHLDDGGGDLIARMPIESYNKLKENDEIKKGKTPLKTKQPRWTHGDSKNIDEVYKDEKFDLVFSCPPYADLEVYSDDPSDLSNMPYEEFKNIYFEIIKKSCDLLNENRFAVFVVADVRNKNGSYKNFVSHTIEGFEKAGLSLYNEMILVNVIASLPIRVGNQFSKSRKVGKHHQNVLVFYKGDTSKITEHFPILDLSYLEDITTEEENDEF